MKRKSVEFVVFLSIVCSSLVGSLAAQDLPLSSVSLYSSGVGFFLHQGNVAGETTIPLVFDVSSINDILKSLVVSDTDTSKAFVSYPSEETLEKTLRSLKIDLSGNPGLADLFAGMRGAEIRIGGAKDTVGRIMGVEQVSGGENGMPRQILSVSNEQGISQFEIKDIKNFSFTDKEIEKDLTRALDLIAISRNEKARTLSVHLYGSGSRVVSLGYVAPAAVWKATYRLAITDDGMMLQGWAIVDNTGDMDWNNVRLSLVTGRPVSFIQDLYPPLFFSRPVVPLSIAGAAQASVYESGFVNSEVAAVADEQRDSPAAPSAKLMMSRAPAAPEIAGQPDSGSSTHGDSFYFTLPGTVSIARQQSAMLPLLDSRISGEKVSVFTAGSKHPKLSVLLSNTTGMKLPAGAMTVLDGGKYAGDALVEFFPENEKRQFAFGDDLSVTVSESKSNTESSTSITASKGVMTITKKKVFAKNYLFMNSDSVARNLVLEHPFVPGASLTSLPTYDDRTDSLYRFNLVVPASGQLSFAVREEQPVRQTIVLADLDLDSLLFYSAGANISANARTALEKAVDLRKKVDAANELLSRIEENKSVLLEDEDRIRKNIDAAGNTSQQGKEYLKKLAQAETDIDKLSGELAAANKTAKDAISLYEAYLSALDLR